MEPQGWYLDIPSLRNSIQVSLAISRRPITPDAYHNACLSRNVCYSQRYSFHTIGHDRRVQKRLYIILLLVMSSLKHVKVPR